MLSNNREIRISDILFDSDVDSNERQARDSSRHKDRGLWRKNVRQYKILSAGQIVALEEFFISRDLPVTKTNIKWAAKELKIPYQRSADYLYNKYKKAQEDTGAFHQRCIKEFNTVTQSIEKCWDSYLKGCEAYGMAFMKRDRS